MELDDESIMPGRPTPLQDRVLRGTRAANGTATSNKAQRTLTGAYKRPRRDSDTSSTSSAPYSESRYNNSTRTTHHTNPSRNHNRAYGRHDDSPSAISNKSYYSSHTSTPSGSRNHTSTSDNANRSSSYSQSPYKRFKASSPPSQPPPPPPSSSSFYPSDSITSRRGHNIDDKSYLSSSQSSYDSDRRKRYDNDPYDARSREAQGSDGRKYYKNWTLDLREQQSATKSGDIESRFDSNNDSGDTTARPTREWFPAPSTASDGYEYDPHSPRNPHSSSWKPSARKTSANPSGYMNPRSSSHSHGHGHDTVNPNTIPVKMKTESRTESLLSRITVPSSSSSFPYDASASGPSSEAYSPQDPYFHQYRNSDADVNGNYGVNGVGHGPRRGHGINGDVIDVDAFDANENTGAGVPLLHRVSSESDREMKLKAEAQDWLDALEPELLLNEHRESQEREREQKAREQQEKLARAKEQIERIRLEREKMEIMSRVRVKMEEDDSGFLSANGFVEVHNVDAPTFDRDAHAQANGFAQNDRTQSDGRRDMQAQNASSNDLAKRRKTPIKVEQDDNWNGISSWSGLTLSKLLNTLDTAIVIDDDEHPAEDTGPHSKRHHLPTYEERHERHESDVEMEMSDTEAEHRHEEQQETLVVKQEPEDGILPLQVQEQAQEEMQVGWGFRPTAWDVFRNTPIEIDTPESSEEPEAHGIANDSNSEEKNAEEGNFLTESHSRNGFVASDNAVETGLAQADVRDEQWHAHKQDSHLVQRQLASENAPVSPTLLDPAVSEDQEDTVPGRVEDASNSSEQAAQEQDSFGIEGATSRTLSVDRRQAEKGMETRGLWAKKFKSDTSQRYKRSGSVSSIASSTAPVADLLQPDAGTNEVEMQEPTRRMVSNPERPDDEMTDGQRKADSAPSNTSFLPASVLSPSSSSAQPQQPVPLPAARVRPLSIFIPSEQDDPFSIPGLFSSTSPSAPSPILGVCSTTSVSNDRLSSEETTSAATFSTSASWASVASASTDATFVNEDDQAPHSSSIGIGKSSSGDCNWNLDQSTKDLIGELYIKMSSGGLGGLGGVGRNEDVDMDHGTHPYVRRTSGTTTPNPYLMHGQPHVRHSPSSTTPIPYTAQTNPVPLHASPKTNGSVSTQPVPSSSTTHQSSNLNQDSPGSTPPGLGQPIVLSPGGSGTKTKVSFPFKMKGRSKHVGVDAEERAQAPYDKKISERAIEGEERGKVPSPYKLKDKRKHDDVEEEAREAARKRGKVVSSSDGYKEKESIESMLERQKGISAEYEQLQMEIGKVKQRQQPRQSTNTSSKGKQKAIEETDEDIPSKTRAWGARSPRGSTRDDDWDYAGDRDGDDYYRLEYGVDEDKTTERRRQGPREPSPSPKLTARQREDMIHYLEEELESVQRQLWHGMHRQDEILEKLKELGASEMSMGVMLQVAGVGSPKRMKKSTGEAEREVDNTVQTSTTEIAPGSDILMKTRLQLAEKKFEAEKTRRMKLENTLKEIEKECREPFIVPALLDAFMMISELSNGVNAQAERVAASAKVDGAEGQSTAMDVT
ncbi:hypothetical protein D9758_005520 [Tetrapyrgos nigripes]|uniref:Uncharacterized protein n=1 Tax=Tetrapyrgos nigripes TaxID=182062 RepID=A0A8H5GGV1_9AGAR|nr:hypothetical protein D9758_005520 [Tetrapyrgos nigripes]